MLTLNVQTQRFPIAGGFAISRGSRTESVVVVATLDDNRHQGRGECVPYTRYGESVASVSELLADQAKALADGADLEELLAAMPAGAARNALDCAAWDLRAKQNGARVWDLAGLPAPGPVTTCFTISLGSPEAMFEAARKAAARPLLKVKLGADGDPERIAAVRRGAPDARLVVDANEGWRADNLAANMLACQRAQVELIEQPLPAGADDLLNKLNSPITICADESLHDRASLNKLPKGYRAINIKLDKTGGLSEAIAVARLARALDLQIMVGCMVGTSLAMAPAMMLTTGAAYVDLDGPLLLEQDRQPGLLFEGSTVYPPAAELWG